MPTIFENTRSWYRPRIICDKCEQPITEVRQAMVLYGQPDDPEITTTVLYSHKEESCQNWVRKKAGHPANGGSWDELMDHLVMLAADSGFFPDDFAQRYEDLLRRDMVPPPPCCH